MKLPDWMAFFSYEIVLQTSSCYSDVTDIKVHFQTMIAAACTFPPHRPTCVASGPLSQAGSAPVIPRHNAAQGDHGRRFGERHTHVGVLGDQALQFFRSSEVFPDAIVDNGEQGIHVWLSLRKLMTIVVNRLNPKMQAYLLAGSFSLVRAGLGSTTGCR